MGDDQQIPTGRAPEQLIAFAQQLKQIREHIIQILLDRYVFRTIQGIVRRNPKLEGKFCSWTQTIYAVAASITIRRVAGTNYQPDDVNLMRLFDCIIRDPEVLWVAFEKHFPTDAQQARSAVPPGDTKWRRIATKRLVGEDHKLLINGTKAVVEFANKRVAHHNAEAEVQVKFFEVDPAIDVLRELTEKYSLLVWDEPTPDLHKEMLRRKLHEGWDSIFLEPWATKETLALPLGEMEPPAFWDGHWFETRKPVEEANYQQICGACEGVRHVTLGRVQWIDRDGHILPEELSTHLEKSCPGPIEQPTLREHYNYLGFDELPE